MISIPTVPVYLKEKTYWKLVMEAEKLQVKVGKFVSMIADEYVKYLESRGDANAEKKVFARR